VAGDHDGVFEGNAGQIRQQCLDLCDAAFRDRSLINHHYGGAGAAVVQQQHPDSQWIVLTRETVYRPHVGRGLDIALVYSGAKFRRRDA